MFDKLKKFWKEYGFEICLIFSILIIIFFYFFDKNKKGTWASKLPEEYLNRQLKNTNLNLKKNLPKESKGEKECRRVLEEIFQKPFIKSRPDFLRNPITSNDNDTFNLELDCYNSQLKIACEYNGIQHYKFNPFFHKNKESFQNQKYRDYMKRELCKKNNIFLIEVPYTIKIDDIKKYIIDNLKFEGYL